MKIKCTVDIQDDVIIGVLDAGFSYASWWCGALLVTRGKNIADAWAGHVMSGGAVAITVDDKYGETGALLDQGKTWYTYRLDRETVEKGLQLLANDERCVRHFSDIIQDSTDAITGDVLIQFALFGSVVFD